MPVLHKFPWYKRYYYALRLGWYVEHNQVEERDKFYIWLKKEVKKYESV